VHCNNIELDEVARPIAAYQGGQLLAKSLCVCVSE